MSPYEQTYHTYTRSHSFWFAFTHSPFFPAFFHCSTIVLIENISRHLPPRHHRNITVNLGFSISHQQNARSSHICHVTPCHYLLSYIQRRTSFSLRMYAHAMTSIIHPSVHASIHSFIHSLSQSRVCKIHIRYQHYSPPQYQSTPDTPSAYNPRSGSDIDAYLRLGRD